MNNDLIERINGYVYKQDDHELWHLLEDCQSEIRRLTKALEAKPVGEPVAWAIFLSNELVDLAMIEPEFSHDYTLKPLYTAPPNVEALIAEIDGLERIDFDEGGCDYPCSDGDNYRFDDVRAVVNKYRGVK